MAEAHQDRVPDGPCGFCRATDSVPLYPTRDVRGRAYTIRRCRACGAYFLAPRPTPGELAEAYRQDYYGPGERKFQAGWMERLLDACRRRRAGLVTRRLPPGGRVLDVGCGSGQVLELIRARTGAEIHGLELPGPAAERAARVPGLRLKLGPLARGDYEPHSFDAVTLFHVFEHLTEPRENLAVIASLLRPGGVLVVSFPNIASWESRWFRGRWFHADPPRHLFFFAPRDFKALMKRYGFKTVHERYFNVEYNPYGLIQSTLNVFQERRDVLYELLKGNRGYADDYSRGNLLLQRLVFLLAAPAAIALDAFLALFRASGTVEFVLTKVAEVAGDAHQSVPPAGSSTGSAAGGGKKPASPS